jgi:2,3-bisphosphoglycerate-dependent phosphoglycerate mutase
MMKSMKMSDGRIIYLARHAQAENHHLFHGAESDVPLSEEGFQQAEALATYAESVRIKALACSGMLRAKQTTDAITRKLGLLPTIYPALHERRVGELSGTLVHREESPWWETQRQWQAGNLDYTSAGAESYQDMLMRLLPAWQQFLDDHPTGNSLIVLHGIVIKVLLTSLLENHDHRDWEKLGPIKNGAVCVLEFQANRMHLRQLIYTSV